MKKDPAIFLGHILDSIELIESYSRGKTELDLMESVGLQDQIIRRIEIIGEAVKNLPGDLRKDHPEVPWRDMTGMRDIVIHQYLKGNRLARAVRILEILNGRERLIIPRVAESFEVKERAITRDIKFLKDNELVEFIGSPKKGWYVITEKGKKLLSDLR